MWVESESVGPVGWLEVGEGRGARSERKEMELDNGKGAEVLIESESVGPVGWLGVGEGGGARSERKKTDKDNGGGAEA